MKKLYPRIKNGRLAVFSGSLFKESDGWQLLIQLLP